jgi:hypothetical protein
VIEHGPGIEINRRNTLGVGDAPVNPDGGGVVQTLGGESIGDSEHEAQGLIELVVEEARFAVDGVVKPFCHPDERIRHGATQDDVSSCVAP